jgi:hypothetical protein
MCAVRTRTWLPGRCSTVPVLLDAQNTALHDANASPRECATYREQAHDTTNEMAHLLCAYQMRECNSCHLSLARDSVVRSSSVSKQTTEQTCSGCKYYVIEHEHAEAKDYNDPFQRRMLAIHHEDAISQCERVRFRRAG